MNLCIEYCNIGCRKTCKLSKQLLGQVLAKALCLDISLR